MDKELLWVALLIPAAIVFTIVYRYTTGLMGKDHIESYLEKQGGKLASAKWTFSSSWFGETTEHFYTVRYFDRDGNEHTANVKTGVTADVFFSHDRIIRYAAPLVDTERVESLEDENAHLRAELDRLKRKEHERGSDAIQE